jgi:hypothetical protein
MQGVGWDQRPWLSPYGILQWSLLLELPPDLEHRIRNSDAFTRLLGLTVVETCLYLLGTTASSLGLNGPSDIYANVNGRLVKIGGIVMDTIQADPGREDRVLIGTRFPLPNYARLMLQQDAVSMFSTVDPYTRYRYLLVRSFPWREYSPKL